MDVFIKAISPEAKIAGQRILEFLKQEAENLPKRIAECRKAGKHLDPLDELGWELQPTTPIRKGRCLHCSQDYIRALTPEEQKIQTEFYHSLSQPFTI
jgi:hypothetical protein